MQQDLLEAAAEGYAPRVRRLIQYRANIDHKYTHDLTVLHHAAFNGHGDVVAILLNEGANVNEPSSVYGTPTVMGFSVEFMLGVLKQCIDEFEAEALKLQIDPAPSK